MNGSFIFHQIKSKGQNQYIVDFEKDVWQRIEKQKTVTMLEIRKAIDHPNKIFREVLDEGQRVRDTYYLTEDDGKTYIKVVAVSMAPHKTGNVVNAMKCKSISNFDVRKEHLL